ncbi:MAG TPA: ArsR family transcriptional regulator [Bacteroidales bacterium]|nr:ArsR family transcriptional regulator [Bacteroidales bacterium]HPI67672.1 ArsR family transcriptional regulator [Bacteroidales bacterium]HPR72023.1 ArsR family transcriptional regulator [Bacteroidales bacterium]
MEIEKGKTFKYLRERREIPEKAKENLKNYTRIKKLILDALRKKEMTIMQLSQELDIPGHEVLYYLMTMVKYGLVQTGTIDDMDEYYTYKLAD